MYAFPYVFNVVAFILSEDGFRNSQIVYVGKLAIQIDNSYIYAQADYCSQHEKLKPEKHGPARLFIKRHGLNLPTSESGGSTGLVRKCLLLSAERAMIGFGVWA